MTLPIEVSRAIDHIRACALLVYEHLLNQDAEIERLAGENAYLREQTKAPAVVWQQRADHAESRLAAADALLRGIAGCKWFNREAPATVELIEAHLQSSDAKRDTQNFDNNGEHHGS